MHINNSKMKNILKDIIEDIEITNWHILALFITMEIVLIYTMDNYVLTREVYGNIYADKLDISSIDNLYIFMKKFSFWGYLFSPILIIIRVAIVALLIQLLFMLGLRELSFKKIFRITLLGYGFLLLASVTKIIMLLMTPVEVISTESLANIPFSIAFLLSADTANDVFRGILNNINLFEVLWIFSVGAGVSIISELKYNRAYMITMSVWMIIFLFKTGVNLYLYSIFEI